MKKLILTALILLGALNYLFSQIQSTTQGGEWNNPASWVGNIIPGNADDVIINGPVRLFFDNPTINSITINTGGSLTSGWESTITVLNNVSVLGEVLTDEGNFNFNIGGDLNLQGNWIGKITFTGSGDHHIVASNDVTITPQDNFIAEGTLYINTDLHIVGNLSNLITNHLILNDSITLYVDRYRIGSKISEQYYSIKTFIEGGTIKMSGGVQAYYENCDLKNVKLEGFSALNNGVNFSGDIINKDTLTTCYSAITSTFNDNFTNNGIIYGQNDNSLTLDILGTLTNNGTIYSETFHKYTYINTHGNIVNTGNYQTTETKLLGSSNQNITLENALNSSQGITIQSNFTTLQDSYQWLLNNNEINNEIDSTVTLNNIATDGATYQCEGTIGSTQNRSREIIINGGSSIPLEISDINISNLNTTGATISWNTNIPAQGFIFFAREDTSSGLPYEAMEAHEFVTSHSITFDTLSPATTYYFMISQFDENWNETRTKTLSFTTLQELDPLEISDINISNLNTTGATISWNTNIPAQGFIFFAREDTSSGLPYEAMEAHEFVTSHSITFDTLSPATTYYFMISQFDENWNETRTKTLSFTTLQELDPLEISDINISNLNTTGATISWNTNIPAQGFIFFAREDTSSGLPYEAMEAHEFVTSHSITFDTLSPATTYYFMISQFDENWNETRTKTLSFTTLQELDPLEISDVNISNLSTTGATISWNTNIPAQGFIFFAREDTSSGLPYEAMEAHEFVTSHSITFDTLSPATTYYFMISQFDENWNETRTKTLSFTTEDIKPSIEINNVQVEAISKTKVRISWSTNVPTHGYIFYAENDTTNGYPMEAMEPVEFSTEHIITLSSLSFTSKYYFIIDQNNEEWSFIRSATYSFVIQEIYESKDPYTESLLSIEKLENVPGNAGAHFYDAAFISSDIAYIVNSENKLFKTVDGGQTWSDITPETAVFSTIKGATPKVSFFNENIGAVAFSVDDGANEYNYSIVYATVYCTTDGGQTWSEPFDVADDQILHLKQVDEFTTFISGTSSYGVSSNRWFKKITRDENSGAFTLNSISTTPSDRPHVMAGDWLNDKFGVVIAKYNVSPTYPASIFKTTDGGTTWTELAEIPIAQYKLYFSYSDASIQVINEDKFIFSAYRHDGTNYISYLMVTEDGGNTWNDLSSFEPNPNACLLSFKLNENNIGLIAGYTTNDTIAKPVYYTQDLGKSWNEISLPEIISPTWIYAAETTYDGCTWAIGSNQQIWRSVDALPTPAADFNTSVIKGQAPLLVQFYDLSNGTPTSWSWDFNNDGITDSEEQNPSYTFNEIGKYSVKLTVSGTYGTDSIIKENYIIVTDSLNSYSPKMLNSFNLYPNPASNYVKINNVEEQYINLQIFNISGDLITKYSTSEQEITIDITEFKKGIYTVRLNNKMLKLIKK